jgi:hypothetical protein
MKTELVEWQVGKYDDQGRLTTTRDGAQSVFSKSRAEALSKKRGPEWSLFHFQSGLSPEAHERLLDAPRKDDKPSGESQ